MSATLEHDQPAALACLQRAIARGRLPHALVFSSPGDVGEMELAQRLAQFLLCEQPAGPLAPCGTCDACYKVARNMHPDMHEVKPKGLLRAIKTDDMLALIQELQATTLAGGAKIGIIHQAETLRKESANRFLKTLEEPPPATYFVLITTRLERLLPTIRSRCQIVRLQPLPMEVVRARLLAQFQLKPDDVELVCRVARGRWCRAVQLAGQVHEYREMVRRMGEAVQSRADASLQAVELARALAQQAKDRRAAFDDECKQELKARAHEWRDVEPSVRREMLDALEEDLKSAFAAAERDEKASIFEALTDMWRDVWVLQSTGSRAHVLHQFMLPVIETLARTYSEYEIMRTLMDINLVRGPAVYLNARLDLAVQGLLAHATLPLEPRVPLRGALLASRL